jgi:tRNA-uridine 2-sulfurtransferase
LKKKAIVALSGGVDSAVAAALLLEQGWEVAGLTMEVVPPECFQTGQNRSGVEPGKSLHKASQEARKVADFLQIPFFSVNFEKEFREKVIHSFFHEYLAGRTPNPCVVCNRFIKFGLLQEEALKLGAEIFATGHYVRILCENGRYLLNKGLDRKKDQSYFLFSLQQEQLARTIFPLGSLTKDEVRRMAQKMGMPSPDRSESQDICFIPDQDYIGFLESELHIEGAEGDIVHVSGKVLGRHQGTYRYTVGQRKGLGIAWPEPLYVIRVDSEEKKVVVGEKKYLEVSRLQVTGVNWVAQPPSATIHCKCRIRYRHHEAPAQVIPLEDGRADVLFEEPQEGVTPGQAAVFYRDDLVVGGGWIR